GPSSGLSVRLSSDMLGSSRPGLGRGLRRRNGGDARSAARESKTTAIPRRAGPTAGAISEREPPPTRTTRGEGIERRRERAISKLRGFQDPRAPGADEG